MAHLSSLLYFCISNRSSGSQVYNLTFGSLRIPVFCHMEDFGCGVGGWTPIMKIDGNKAWHLSLITIFHFFFQFFCIDKSVFALIMAVIVWYLELLTIYLFNILKT